MNNLFINDCGYKYQIREYFGYTNGKQVMKTLWTCPIYSAWRGMQSRCKSPYQEKYPSYRGTNCVEDWKTFSKFHEWAVRNFSPDLELDKDILLSGNKTYGPDTCAFVPKHINYLLNSFKNGVSGNLPMGVTRTANKLNKFRAAISSSGSRINIGVYQTKEAAHKAWQIAKAAEIENSVAVYAKEVFFRADVADALISRAWKIRLENSMNLETKQI